MAGAPRLCRERGFTVTEMKVALDVPTAGEFADPLHVCLLIWLTEAVQVGWGGFFILDAVLSRLAHQGDGPRDGNGLVSD